MKNGKSTSHRTKHISARHFFIKEKIDEGEIEVENTPTLQMLVDMIVICVTVGKIIFLAFLVFAEVM